MNGTCGLTVGSSLHCFVQVVYGCAKAIVKNSKVIFPLTVQNACPRGKAQGTGAGVEVTAEVHLMLYLYHFYQILGSPWVLKYTKHPMHNNLC